MANELYVKRTAVAPLLVAANTANETQYSNQYIPAGAIITGIRIVGDSGVTAVTAAADQLINAMVGAQSVGATLAVSDHPAETVGIAGVLAATGGVIVMTSGELVIYNAASDAATASGSWKYYVDYLFVPE